MTEPLAVPDLIDEVKSGIVRIEAEGCDGEATGTGFLVGSRLVVTVEHVIDEAAVIRIKRQGVDLGTATVIGADVARDLALLRTKAPIDGYHFTLAARPPRLGEEVAAIGFPLGLPLSVSRGSISGLNRTIPIDGLRRRRLIQTDAPVNRGNSGGPLIALDSGEVVGLIDLGSDQIEGIAFAVSSQVAKALVEAWRTAPQPIPVAACAPREQAPEPHTTGVPAVYEGRFTSFDRLQRCFATDAYATCSSGPSGKAVRLVAGGAATYLGTIGSVDRGGPDMPMGTSFRTPRGNISCDSSTRGITCTDVASGNRFVIGDYRLRLRNGGTEVIR
ncbi:MAG: S1C family serine protease [Gaiellaceae bacterium]